MRGITALATVVAAPLLFGASSPKGNLVPNGSFERGKGGAPVTWQRPDGLTSFWVSDPLRKGKCLKIDTDVAKEEYRARQKEMTKDPVPPAKPKTPTTGDKYDTVAGVEGVSYYSAWIRVTPGQHYRLEADVRTEQGTKTPKIFVKGYLVDPRRPKPHQRRVAYKKYLNCPATVKWQTFRTTFCPTVRSADVTWLRVMIFAYWPPGIYYFDNVKVVPVDPPPKEKTPPRRSPTRRKEM